MPLSFLSYAVFIVVVLTAYYFMFPRQFRNAMYAVVPKWRREFVIVHFRKIATRTPLTYYIIPDRKTGYAHIDGGQYELINNSLPERPEFKKRLHFLVDEGNPIPVSAKIEDISDQNVIFAYKGKLFCQTTNMTELPNTQKKIVTWAFSLNSAFQNIGNLKIFGKNMNIAFIIACIAVFVAVVTALYAISELHKIMPLVETIYQRTLVGNETLMIKPK